MSRVAKVAMVAVLIAGILLVALDQRSDSTDAQAALVTPFLIFWTILALAAIALLDVIVRAMWRHFAKPS